MPKAEATLQDTPAPSAGSDLSLSKRLTPEVFLALAASLDPEPGHPLRPYFWGLPGTVQAQRGPSCLASNGRRPPIVLVEEATPGPKDRPGGIRGTAWLGARPGLAGWPSSCIRPRARCLSPPLPAELRSVIPAAAMKCLLLALALTCGAQALIVTQTMKGLDIQKVRGWPGGW